MYRSELYRFVRARVEDEAAAEDLVHDVLLRAYSQRDTLRMRDGNEIVLAIAPAIIRATMSLIQRILKAVLPRRWAESMEADSRSWMARCPCGFARSIWELGGIRWKAAGQPRHYLTCPQCGQRSWHTVTRELQS